MVKLKNIVQKFFLNREVVEANILRMGVFNSVANGMYLNLVAEQNVLEYLPKQPDVELDDQLKDYRILIAELIMKYI